MIPAWSGACHSGLKQLLELAVLCEVVLQRVIDFLPF
jgi:hypothetical protein